MLSTESNPSNCNGPDTWQEEGTVDGAQKLQLGTHNELRKIEEDRT